MKGGGQKGWYELKHDEQINVGSLAAVAEWWDVQEVKGYQLRPRQLGVLKDRAVVLVNNGKFKWYRPSALFTSAFHPQQPNMLTIEYKAGAADGYVATESLLTNLIFSNAADASSLRGRLSEIHIQQLAGQAFMDAELSAAEKEIQSIQDLQMKHKQKQVAVEPDQLSISLSAHLSGATSLDSQGFKRKRPLSPASNSSEETPGLVPVLEANI